MDKKFKRFIKEPVIQFMGIGLLMFLANTYILQSDYSDDNEYIVTLTAGEVDAMKEIWTSKWQRPPTEIEMKGMINQRIEEAILFKEAVKLGLDKDDDIIRQRMSQKLEFLTNDLVKPDTATIEEVQLYFDKNIENYIAPETITITQLFVDPKTYQSSLDQEVKTRLEKLNVLDISSSSVSNYGDTFLLQSYFPDKSQIALAKLFGSEFAKSIFELETETWVGPINSQYGVHLVYVINKTPAIIPELKTIKELVTEDLYREEQQKINKLYIDGILARYEVIIEDTNNH